MLVDRRGGRVSIPSPRHDDPAWLQIEQVVEQLRIEDLVQVSHDGETRIIEVTPLGENQLKHRRTWTHFPFFV
jgi:hypothetical protein